LRKLGFHLGSDLNEALDNLWFTLLFKRPEAMDCSNADFCALLTIFEKVMYGSGTLSRAEIRAIRAAAARSRAQHDSEWLSARAESLIRECAGPARENSMWGWKEPNTHLVLPRLKELAPHVRYIHVVRNGLDMAYSQNQNPLRAWGTRFLGMDPVTVTPRFSLKFWVAVQRRVLETAQGMSGRFLMIDYDRFCADPARELPSLLEFIGLEASPARLAGAASLVRPPDSIGRFKAFPRDHFDPDDVAFVASMGFDAEWPT
jgi:hypothetical protein